MEILAKYKKESRVKRKTGITYSRNKSEYQTAILVALAVFLGWRFVRPINIFVVSEAFERPIPTDRAKGMFKTLSAEECAACHADFYAEWRTSIHSQAWTDPYFQADWRFDGEQQICKNCHTPLDRQQEHRVLGFHDKEKWDPILAPNPDFDPVLQHEGVTCAACHFRDGQILGPYGIDDAPHPVKKLEDPNQMCLRCHIVHGDRWDTFYRIPPCGTVAEIRAGAGTQNETGEGTFVPFEGRAGEIVSEDLKGFGCVQCHMPLVERHIVSGGEVRQTRRHLWRGGHDPERVKQGLKVALSEEPTSSGNKRRFTLTLTNVGAAHFLPTGTPDRHLTVALRLLDKNGAMLKEERHTLKRMILWRPFIIDLWDSRLPFGEPRHLSLTLDAGTLSEEMAVEAVVRYHLLDEKRRKQIGYENEEPIAYEVFNQRTPIKPFNTLGNGASTRTLASRPTGLPVCDFS